MDGILATAIDRFFYLTINKKIPVPGHGFKKMDVSLFLNHSDRPNIISIHDRDYFEAIRDIKPGEELLVDYGEIVDGE